VEQVDEHALQRPVGQQLFRAADKTVQVDHYDLAGTDCQRRGVAVDTQDIQAADKGSITPYIADDAGEGVDFGTIDDGAAGGRQHVQIALHTYMGDMRFSLYFTVEGDKLTGTLGEDDVIRSTSSNPMGSFEFEAVRGEF